MKTYIAVAFALVLAGGAIATGAVQNTSYVTAYPNGSPTLTIWCGQGGHNVTPLGDPEDYGDTSDPANNPDGFVGAHESWAFSGEPECAPTDAAFGTEDDAGIGGAAFCVAGTINGRDCADHRGHDFLSTTNDVAGLPYHQISFETCPVELPDCDTNQNTAADIVSGAGCGTASVQIPSNMARHWQSPVSQPTFLGWDRIKAAFVDPASGAVCLGGSGTITAEF